MRFRAPTLAFLVLVSGCADVDVTSPLLPRGLAYLASVQNEDGGFPAGPGGASEFSTSAWVALAFGSADPGHDAVTPLREYLTAQSTAVRDNTTGSFSRINAVSLFVLAGDAVSIPDVDGHVERLRVEASNASLAANEQIFLLGALGRIGEHGAAKPLAASIRSKLLDREDPSLAKDAWMRANAVLALLAANESADNPDVRAAARSLLEFQKEDAGFRSSTEFEPDASTTAAVVAVLSQVRFVYSHERVTGLEFLTELQNVTGAVRFSHEFDFAPAKTTAEAVLAATGDGPFRR